MSDPTEFAEPGTWVELLTDSDVMLRYRVGEPWPHPGVTLVAGKLEGGWLKPLAEPTYVAFGRSVKVAVA